MSKKVLAISVFIVFSFGLNAQILSMESIELVEDKIDILYSLEDENEDHEYKVNLYSSLDNFAEPLTKVSGDIGSEIMAGSNKKIQWNILEEIGGYSGDLSLEIRARVYIPFVKLTGFEEGTSFKKGKPYPLLWTSGNMGGQLDIELYEVQSRVAGDRNVPNSGKYEYVVPGSVKPGKEYRLKFTNTRNRDEFVYSNEFRIQPRIPFAVKLGSTVIVTAVAYYIIKEFWEKKPIEDPVLDSHPGFPEN